MKKKSCREHLQAKLKNQIPLIVDSVLEAYRAFTAEPPPDEVKEFTAHFAARKACITHLEQLIKISQWAERDEPVQLEQSEPSLASLLAEAQRDLDTITSK